MCRQSLPGAHYRERCRGYSLRRRQLTCACPILLAALLCLGVATAGAQELRRSAPAAFNDSARRAALQSRSDTGALLKLLLPAALDSLVSDTSANALWSQVARYPQLQLSDKLGSAVDTIWLVGLVAERRVRGVCAPIKRACRRTTTLDVTLEDEPGEGDNAVLLVLSVIPRIEPLFGWFDRHSGDERRSRLWAMGVFLPPPQWWAPPITYSSPARLRAERLATAWRITSWTRSGWW